MIYQLITCEIYIYFLFQFQKYFRIIQNCQIVKLSKQARKRKKQKHKRLSSTRKYIYIFFQLYNYIIYIYIYNITKTKIFLWKERYQPLSIYSSHLIRHTVYHCIGYMLYDTNCIPISILFLMKQDFFRFPSQLSFCHIFLFFRSIPHLTNPF